MIRRAPAPTRWSHRRPSQRLDCCRSGQFRPRRRTYGVTAPAAPTIGGRRRGDAGGPAEMPPWTGGHARLVLEPSTWWSLLSLALPRRHRSRDRCRMQRQCSPAAWHRHPDDGAVSDPMAWTHEPKEGSVSVGDTVDSTNAATNPHTLTSTDALFDSGFACAGETFTWWTPNAPGTFRFVCSNPPVDDRAHRGAVVEACVVGIRTGPVIASTPQQRLVDRLAASILAGFAATIVQLFDLSLAYALALVLSVVLSRDVPALGVVQPWLYRLTPDYLGDAGRSDVFVAAAIYVSGRLAWAAIYGLIAKPRLTGVPCAGSDSPSSRPSSRIPQGVSMKPSDPLHIRAGDHETHRAPTRGFAGDRQFLGEHRPGSPDSPLVTVPWFRSLASATMASATPDRGWDACHSLQKLPADRTGALLRQTGVRFFGMEEVGDAVGSSLFQITRAPVQRQAPATSSTRRLWPGASGYVRREPGRPSYGSCSAGRQGPVVYVAQFEQLGEAQHRVVVALLGVVRELTVRTMISVMRGTL